MEVVGHGQTGETVSWFVFDKVFIDELQSYILQGLTVGHHIEGDGGDIEVLTVSQKRELYSEKIGRERILQC